jgi:hypothetical protein
MCLEKYPNDWQVRLTAVVTLSPDGTSRTDPYGRNWSLG